MAEIQPRVCRRRLIVAGPFLAAFGLIAGVPLRAADPPLLSPDLVGSFTRTVQPMLLNRCAAAGCHGGRNAHAPVFLRGNAAGQIDREVTLANIDAFRKQADSKDRVQHVMARLAASHPDARSPSPLEPAKLALLRDWLLEACQPPTATTAAAVKPNRFREMLEQAGDPTPLWPPPQSPKGVLLKNDE